VGTLGGTLGAVDSLSAVSRLAEAKFACGVAKVESGERPCPQASERVMEGWVTCENKRAQVVREAGHGPTRATRPARCTYISADRFGDRLQTCVRPLRSRPREISCKGGTRPVQQASHACKEARQLTSVHTTTSVVAHLYIKAVGEFSS
jgi:hypothetical protein